MNPPVADQRPEDRTPSRNTSAPHGVPRPPGPQLLLVEDDPTIAEPLVEGLEYEGFAVRWVPTGQAALADPGADLVLLDLGLPDVDGREVCRTLTARSATPVVVVTARGDEFDRVLLLELGADDYVVKPFGFRELVARIRAVLRRGARTQAADGRQELGALSIDRRGRQVRLAGCPVELTTKEFDLLALLAEEPGTVRRREDIIARVWDENWWGSTKTLDVHVASLRKKLGDPRWIATLRGVGYRLDVPP
ncbi:response regulator transcription factor [Geodermatophilus sp. SYSU D00758]